MKQFVLISILLISLNSFSQVKDVKEMKKVCKEMLEIIKEHSIVSDSFDWKTYPQKIDSIILANNHQDSFRKIRHIIINDLKARGDNHSSYFNINRINSWKKEKDSFLYPNCKILDSCFGYIDMPGLPSLNDPELKNYEETIRAQIKKIDQKFTIKGWIIDLRNNSGGIFEKMLSGLNPLIEDGIVGYNIIKNKKEPWIASIRNSKNNEYELIDYKCKNRFPKIIVLIDSNSASAAEMICVALCAYSNIKIIGNNTMGLTTKNKMFFLSNRERLNLAIGYFADRNGKIYTGKLKPDIFVTNEEAIDKAKELILK